MYLTTKKKYGFFEATSAFQKAIRRGDEPTALYFAVELYNSAYDEFLWKRIKIISSEDVGLASPGTPAIINGLYTFYSEMKKDNKDGRPERIFLMHAVVHLVRAKKSRLVDYLMIQVWREHDEIDMPIPDYAFDKHTLKGKQMGRGLDHFYAEGSKIENSGNIPGENEAKAAAKKMIEKYPGKLNFPAKVKGVQGDLGFDPE